MHPSCPKKHTNADMTNPDSAAWCERNRNPEMCWDCSVYGGGERVKKEGKKVEQGRLW